MLHRSLFALFTDKICDQISDAVLDAHLKQDPDAKVACGEFSSVDMSTLVSVFRQQPLEKYSLIIMIYDFILQKLCVRLVWCFFVVRSHLGPMWTTRRW